MMKPADARALAIRLAAWAIDGGEAEWLLGAEELERLDGRSWLLLDQAARSFNYATGTPVSGVGGWLGPSASEPSGFVAAVTSLHVDGRFRERATQLVASVDRPLATSALAVRLLDHVPQVRDRALAEVMNRLKPVTADLVLEVVLAGRGRHPAALALAEIREHLVAGAGAHGPGALRQLMASGRRSVRRWAFTTAHDLGVLEEPELIKAALFDKDQWIQASCADWLMKSEPSGLVPLLRANSVEARLVALSRVPDESLDDETLEQLLVDRSPRVREQARWRARKRQLDVLQVYRRLVTAERSPRVRAASLDGIATLGDESDLPVIVSHLDDPSARVRAAAVGAIVARAEYDAAVESLLGVLDDPSARVSAAAARGLARLRVSPVVVEHLWEATRPATRRAAWRVVRESGDWDRVEADLRAASDHDPQIAGLGEAGIRNWLDVAAATTWANLTDRQRERIESYLRRAHLDDERRRTLAFHAGIKLAPAPTHRPLPSDTSDDGRTKRRWWPFTHGSK
jgi:HEAT repeat protein